MLKCKNTDIIQSELKHHTTEVSEKDKIIQGLKIKYVEKWDELAATEKKTEKAEQKIEYHNKYWSEKAIEYLVEIHDFKSKIKGMQKLNDEDKTETVTKNIIENLVYLNLAH